MSAHVKSGSPGRLGMWTTAPAEQLDQPVDRLRVAGADVVDLADARRVGGRVERARDVGHVHESRAPACRRRRP